MSENLIAYFGYGSLVNLATLRTPYVAAWPAKLRGWERVWLSRPRVEGSFAPIDGLAFLSARLNPELEIDGLIVVDKVESLDSLDTREALYRRHRIDSADITSIRGDESNTSDIPVYMYVADTEPSANDGSRILRSYLDAVFQGYLAHYDVDGIHRFMETTANFDLNILEDRGEPVYPRPVNLSDAEVALFDSIRPPTVD